MITPGTASFTNTLKTGDAIVICFGNRLHLGIFLDVGFRQNVRYFNVNQGRLDWYRKCLAQKNRIYKDFINRPLGRSVAKIDINELNLDTKRIFDETKDILQQNGQL